jgi:aromatic ring-opening dioxygenase catalytic subunit (LigB family)
MGALPCCYIPHGGGPCFFMDWELGPADTWDRMAAFLRGLLAGLPERPRALLVISAHWEADPIRLNGSPRPELIYDYYGFPPHTYELRYPAPGDPALAAHIAELLGAAGVEALLDPDHGLDHGVFIPGLLIRPEADLPIVQLSLHPDLDPARHLALGAALAPLRREGVLILGSGMSYHNMAVLMQQPQRNPAGDAFDAWLAETCALPRLQRDRRLITWAEAPGARDAHPREEHLVPLHVVAGAAGEDRGACIYRDRVLGAPVAAFAFGG